MKLALREDEGFAILDVLGDIDAHSVSVLKVGLTRLFQNGKNRVILHLIETKDLPREVLLEIAALDVLARELSGRILVASPSPEIKEKVKTFAKPALIPILDSVEKAMEYSRDLDILEGEEAGESAAELQKKLEEKAQEVEALKARLQQADGREAQKAREENAELKAKVRLLEGQVEELLRERREPFAMEGALEKMAALEDSVRRLSEARPAGAK